MQLHIFISWPGIVILDKLCSKSSLICLFLKIESIFNLNKCSPRFGKYRDKSPLWKPTEWNHTTTEYKIETWKQRHSNTRVKLRNPKFLYSHEYVGPDPSGNSPNALEGRITYEI